MLISLFKSYGITRAWIHLRLNRGFQPIIKVPYDAYLDQSFINSNSPVNANSNLGEIFSNIQHLYADAAPRSFHMLTNTTQTIKHVANPLVIFIDDEGMISQITTS